MLSDALLEELRHRGEGSDLDYKAERYPFAGATDETKSELLKDILAFANAHRSGTAYIVMGFKDLQAMPAEVIGLDPSNAIDDSRIQQFVNEKLNRKLEFRYEEQLFSGMQIAVISIPKQNRPFYLTRKFGKVDKNIVYIRRGSATGVASPDEVAGMGKSDTGRGDALVTLSFQNEDNLELPDLFDREFFDVAINLPDFELRPRTFDVGALQPNNADYWRELAAFYSSHARVIRVRLSLSNSSNFSLSDTYLEVAVVGSRSETTILDFGSNLPGAPSKDSQFPDISSILSNAHEHSEIDMRSGNSVAHIELGTLRPGQTLLAEDDIAVFPSRPGIYTLQVRVMANEIPTPILVERRVEVSGPQRRLDMNFLKGLDPSAGFA